MNSALDLNELEDAPGVTALAKLAQAAIKPHVQSRPDGTSYALFPDGKIVELTRDPSRKRGTITVHDRESFVEYVTKHVTDGTLVTVEWTNGGMLTLHAVLDHHGTKAPGWAGHSCRAVLTPMPAWREWLSNNGQVMAQRVFAEFIEEHAPGIVVEPTAADMLELATTLEAAASAQFRGGIRLQNGDREFLYKQTTEAKGGQDGQLVIPRLLRLKLRPFPQDQEIQLTARFKYRLESGGLVLFYEIDGLELVKLAMLENARTNLREELGTSVLVLLSSVPTL